MTDTARDAYLAGLRLVAGRDLSAREVRARLLRRAFDPAHAEAAVVRLVAERAIDDLRVALGKARRAAARHRGRARAAGEVRAAGIDEEVAKRALDEIFGALDEREQVERALARRLKTPSIGSPAEFRRLHAFLVRQGFDPATVSAVLRARTRASGAAPVEEDALPEDEG